MCDQEDQHFFNITNSEGLHDELNKHRLIRVHSHKLKAYKPPVAWQEEYAEVFRQKVLNEFKNQTSFQEIPRQEQDPERRQPRGVRQLSPSTLSFDLGEELPENPIPLLDLSYWNQVPAIPKLGPVAAIIQEEMNAARVKISDSQYGTIIWELLQVPSEYNQRRRNDSTNRINVGAPNSDSISSMNGHELVLPPVERPNVIEDPQSRACRGAETADLIIKEKPQAPPIPEEFLQPSVTRSGTDSSSKYL
ncbi:unnamed protein product [Allacma fusca]|uniref:Uncharacterized protein n=1 Tax=Allacma fusca TaxID=39272 RepID=A0A8J2PBT4_9HEXA|nr:unnamed protein product [Allacma fusca]